MNVLHIPTSTVSPLPLRLRRGIRPGFSITELLVVIGVIVLLASLLMVAMGRARTTALVSQSRSTMQGFAASAEAFQTEHGQYPGVIPERVLAEFPAQLDSGGAITFTSTENALLHMMGGYRVLPPGNWDNTPTGNDFDDYEQDFLLAFGSGDNQWQLKIKLSDIGQGPVINGRPYAPYYTPGSREVAVAQGQFEAVFNDEEMGGNAPVPIPDLMDAWGQPIIYLRQIRTSGPLVGEVGSGDRPQFLFGTNNLTRFGGMTGYVRSTALGEFSQDQDDASILNRATDRMATFAQIIRHPAFGDPDDPLTGTARGAFVLISAGADGIYFSVEDGPGRPGNPVDNIVDGQHGDPRVIEDYDDIIFFGGG